MERFQRIVLSALLLLPAAAMAGPGDRPVSTVDLYYVPKADIEVSSPFGSGDDDGDGFGIRGLFRAGEVVMILGEYHTVSYDDSGLDRDDLRIGVGAGTRSGSGGYIEYVSSELSDNSGGSSDATGFGLHGRLAGHVAPNFQLYGDVGYLILEDDFEDIDGLEFSFGAAFAFTPVVGAFVDYRIINLEGDQSEVETEFADVRVGGRLMFGG